MTLETSTGMSCTIKTTNGSGVTTGFVESPVPLIHLCVIIQILLCFGVNFLGGNHFIPCEVGY